MKIQVDRAKCCGSGQCVFRVPEVFDQDEDDGIVLLLQPDPPAIFHDEVLMAANLCPSLAITIVE